MFRHSVSLPVHGIKRGDAEILFGIDACVALFLKLDWEYLKWHSIYYTQNNDNVLTCRFDQPPIN